MHDGGKGARRGAQQSKRKIAASFSSRKVKQDSFVDWFLNSAKEKSSQISQRGTAHIFQQSRVLHELKSARDTQRGLFSLNPVERFSPLLLAFARHFSKYEDEQGNSVSGMQQVCLLKL